MTSKQRDTCPTCGSPVVIVGDTTKHYEPAPAHKELPNQPPERVPPRVWCNLYTNQSSSTNGVPRYHYHTYETEELSHQFRRLANYVRTEPYLSLQEHEKSLEAAVASARAEIIRELREDAYRCTFADYKGSMDKGWLYSVADHLEAKSRASAGKGGE